MSERYICISGNLYFDTVERVIVKSMGNRYVFLRHDRREKGKVELDKVPANRRKNDITTKDFVALPKNLFFDSLKKAIYKKTSTGNFVLYSRDRRKEKTTVATDKRKK
ncbi:MAG: hypothetical protein WCJ46_07815 [bacterium]